MIRLRFGIFRNTCFIIPFEWNGYSRIDLFNLYAYNFAQTENKYC